MPTIDYEARLTKVQAAIDALLTGGHQSYRIDGQEVTKLDLATLQREEERLVGKIKRASRRGGAFRTVRPL
ncbi:hypothetical protein FHY55_19420 [Oceanicola sp. D3]|uniref:hypothetical protein n=1 Tax=Oceanicola sp. D3 TaxID=2587163 RepID=UPI00111DFB68|nr:hypothetical protein [Oceanicola sp. D3]QDC11269.1 hypothetical protein FHY55_19420 [Oceanicola sp. D3]